MREGDQEGADRHRERFQTRVIFNQQPHSDDQARAECE
jgi:hypothetical protein